MRLIDSCVMKLVIIKQFDETNNLMNVFLKLHINKKLNESMNQRQHNHSLKFLDDVKINSVIKLIAKKKIIKKYASIVINKNIQNIK